MLNQLNQELINFVNHLFAIYFPHLKFVMEYANDFLTEFGIRCANRLQYFYQKIFLADLKRFIGLLIFK